MKNNKESASPSPENLLADLRALVSEAESMIAGAVGEQTGEAVESLRTRFAAAQERVSELYDGARKKVLSGAKCTDEAIREHPYQSLAIAAGVGILVGVLLGRRGN